MDSALLQQKVEFLEMEVEELRRREENLKKVNNSLMQAINNEPSLFKDQSFSQLQNANEQYLVEICELKKKHKEELLFFDKQLQELFLGKKELQIDLKHQRAAAESEKFEFLAIIKQLESEKFQLEKSLKQSSENQRLNLAPQDYSSKEKPRLSLDGRPTNDRQLINKELDLLKGKIEVLNTKLRGKKEKIKRFKERNSEKSLKVKIDLLENELESFKYLHKKSSKPSDLEKKLKSDLEEALCTIERLKKSQNTDFKPMMLKKDLEAKQLKEKIIQLTSELEKTNSELSKVHLKLQQHEIYWKMSDEKRSETEMALKSEIKFLIGKLLKAKTKTENGSESKETVNKSGLIPTVRSKSVKKQVVSNKMISPLDLSAITRSESPFYVSKMDL